MRFSSASETIVLLRTRRRRLAGLNRMLWLLPALLRFTRPLPVTLMSDADRAGSSWPISVHDAGEVS